MPDGVRRLVRRKAVHDVNSLLRHKVCVTSAIGPVFSVLDITSLKHLGTDKAMVIDCEVKDRATDVTGNMRYAGNHGCLPQGARGRTLLCATPVVDPMCDDCLLARKRPCSLHGSAPAVMHGSAPAPCMEAPLQLCMEAPPAACMKDDAISDLQTFSTKRDFAHMCCAKDLSTGDAAVENSMTFNVVTDFSGLETPSLALGVLGVSHKLLAASEIDPHLRTLIADNYAPENLHTNFAVANAPLPGEVDLYAAGPPCQDFSTAGLQAGPEGARGCLYEQSVRRIIYLRARAFILENVVGMASMDGGHFLSKMVRLLEEANYVVLHRVVDTQHHGLPQRRRRIYVVGYLVSDSVIDFCWPEELGHVSLEHLLEPSAGGTNLSADRLDALSGLVAANVAHACAKIAALPDREGDDDFIIDADCSAKFRTHPRAVSPCLLRSRPRGFWAVNRGRRLSAAETGLLQGIGTQSIRHNLTDNSFRAACGNAMSINVLTRVMSRLLQCAGLTGPLRDPWEVLKTHAPGNLSVDRCRCLPFVRQQCTKAVRHDVSVCTSQGADLACQRDVLQTDARLVGDCAGQGAGLVCQCDVLQADARLVDECTSRGVDLAGVSDATAPDVVEGPAWMTDCIGRLDIALKRLETEASKLHRISAPHAPTKGIRHRDLFPLPSLSISEAIALLHESDIACGEDMLRFANWTIWGLNLLDGCRCPSPGHATAMQRDSQRRILLKVNRMFARLCAAKPPESAESAWQLLIGETPEGHQQPSSRIKADRCDLLDHSGNVDPLPALDAYSRDILCTPDALFESVHEGMQAYGNVNREDMAEYAKLVSRQLRSTKIVLSDSACAGGTVFAVGKPTGAQREVWHGTQVSQAAKRPPKPPRLVSPTALLSLEVGLKSKLLVSKRDAKCYFDQLRLPCPLRPWFGRPKLRVDMLCKYGGFTIDDLSAHYVGSGTLASLTHVIPLCATFPMGFSWSSFVAQSYLLERCAAAGLEPRLFLSDDSVAPTDMQQLYGLATDDLMIFTVDDEVLARSTVSRFDDELESAGVVRAASKDITAALDRDGVPCIGIDVCDGTFLAPERSKLARLLCGVGHQLAFDVRMSPLSLGAILGHMSWFAQLNRPIYSCFDTVYGFTRQTPDDEARALPPSASLELLLFLALTPLLEADLRRPWSDKLLACDASSVFGFGLSVADVNPARIREIARFADISGSFVRLDRSDPHPHDEPERPRKGIRCDLRLSKHAFKAVISSRARFKAHSGSLEATGLSMSVRWLLRDRKRHSRRVAILVDAQAVLGAAARGRSSAGTIKREIRRYGALVLGGDLLVRLIYVPSEDNPGDAPSRGKRCLDVANKFNKGHQRIARQDRAARRAHQASLLCPGCGVHACNHPTHVPRNKRGGHLFCRPAHGISYCRQNGRWLSESQHREDLVRGLPADDPVRLALRALE